MLCRRWRGVERRDREDACRHDDDRSPENAVFGVGGGWSGATARPAPRWK
jgi:hypothetical protein